MSRIFLSHSSVDSREAIALKQWLIEQDAALPDEIFLDVDHHTGLKAGTRWKDALRQANARCEAVVCLLSRNWEASHECKVEYRTAENLNKQIFVARLEPSAGDDLTLEWQRCDLFGEGPTTQIDIGSGPPVTFANDGLDRLREGLRGAGIGAESFAWPPRDDPGRAPYRGWEPLESADAAVFFGRDAQIVRALDALRGMRMSGVNAWFVVLGPSGTGKSSFLRAGLLPRLRREDRRFAVLDIVRPERSVLTGQSGLAAAIYAGRRSFGLTKPSLGEIKKACLSGDVDRVAAWFNEIRDEAAARLLERGHDEDAPVAPTLLLPLDQAEELFSADAGEQADEFLRLLEGVGRQLNTAQAGLVVTATIRTDRYELMQTHPAMAEVGTVLFDELKPMPPTEFKEVITGPAQRSTDAGQPLKVAPDLVERLLLDAADGADTLPILALTLSRLYIDYGDTGELSLEHYQALGGMHRVVQTEIDEVLAAHPQKQEEELEALRAAFIPWLATINPNNDQPMRRVARWSDLPEASRPLVDALVAKRLMLKDTRDGETVVEVALESLLRQWDELADWLREERQDLKDADDLEHYAHAWEANDRDPAWLLEGRRLDEAVALLDKPGFHERLARAGEYLGASSEREQHRRAAEEHQREAELHAAQERAEHAQEKQAIAEAHSAVLRKRSRVLRVLVAGTATVAVLAIAASVWATSAHSQAQARFRQATAARLESEAQGMLEQVRPGGDQRALQQVLAARLIDNDPNDDAIYSAAVTRHDLVKIIPAGSPVYSVAFSPDGSRIASASDDHLVRVWDRVTGKLVGQPLAGLTDSAFSVAYSPDGQRLAAASEQSVLLWHTDATSGGGTPMQVAATNVKQVIFSPDGHRLATGSSDGTIRLWDANTGAQLAQVLVGPEDAVNSIAFSPDGNRIASGTKDKAVRLWDAKALTPIGEPLTGHKDEVTAVAFSPDGHRLASGSKDKNLYLWDADARRPIVGPMVGHDDVIHEIAFSPDGRMLASAGGDNVVWMWDAGTGTAVGKPLTGHEFDVYSLAFSPDSRYIVTGSYDQSVRLWDVGDMILAGQGELWAVALSPDGRLIASGGDDGSVRLWDTQSGLIVGAPLPGTPKQAVEAVAFSPDGRRVAEGGDDRAIRIWDTKTGKLVGRPLIGHTDLVWTIGFSPDGSKLVSGGADRTIRIWDVDSGAPVGNPITGHTNDVYGVAYSPDGSRIVSGSVDRTIRLWDANTGAPIGKPITGHTNTVDSVAYSPDGKRIVSGASDGLVRQWDADTGAPIGKPLIGHTDAVGSVVYGQQGRLIVSGGYEGDVRLWDAASGRPIGAPLQGHAGLVVGVAINSEHHLVVSAGDDGALRLWSTEASAGDLCSKLTTNMSRAQWNDWVSPDIDYMTTCPGLPMATDQ